MTDFTNELRREAASLRTKVSELRLERDALVDAVSDTEHEYHAACAEVTCAEQNATFEAAERVHDTLRNYQSRLGRCQDAKTTAEARLADLDRLLQAPERAEAGRTEWHAALKTVEAVEKRIADNAKAIDRMQLLRVGAIEAAGRARVAAAARAVAELPEDVRAMLGPQTTVTEAPGDPAAEDAKARALADAIAQTERAADALRAELAQAQATADEGEQELLAHLAAVAEMEHAQALAAYLPKLTAFRAAHEVAHEWMPPMPDYKRHADESRGPAMQAARAAAREGAGGVLRRAARKVAAVLGA